MRSDRTSHQEIRKGEETVKRRKPQSMTVRSTKYLRDRGFVVAKVEQKIHMPLSPFPVTRDAFGFGDLLVAHPAVGIALIQVTTASSNFNKRIRKIQGFAADPDDEKEVEQARAARDNAEVWILSRGKIFVHGWGKKGPRGQKKTWQLVEREITLGDL